MKAKNLLAVILILLSFNLWASAAKVTCDNGQTLEGGVDILPWSVAKPFPWDNISGIWKLGDDSSSYVRAKVQSATNSRKILTLQIYGDGLCSKPYAKGTGYIDVTEKNVVRAILLDNNFRYQMKLGLFDARDLDSDGFQCTDKVLAVSMQIVGRADNVRSNAQPIDPGLTETHNMLLKKLTGNPALNCQ